MTKKHVPQAPEDNAPGATVVDDVTERHLVKARELLREARSRFVSRDADGVEPIQDRSTESDESE